MLSVRELLDSAIDYANPHHGLTHEQLQLEVKRIHSTLLEVRRRLYVDIKVNETDESRKHK